MGVVRTWESRRSEVEAFRRKLVAAAAMHRRMDDEGIRKNTHFSSLNFDDDEEGTTLVCVTSGVSYLGLALVNHLLMLGYSVRIIVDNPGIKAQFGQELHFRWKTKGLISMVKNKPGFDEK